MQGFGLNTSLEILNRMVSLPSPVLDIGIDTLLKGPPHLICTARVMIYLYGSKGSDIKASGLIDHIMWGFSAIQLELERNVHQHAT